MEPILLREATVRGVPTRYNTEFLSFSQDVDGVMTTVRDSITRITYKVRSKFLVGGDGGRSKIIEHLQIPMLAEPAQGIAINVCVHINEAAALF